MLGIPRPDFPVPPGVEPSAEPAGTEQATPPAGESGAPPEPTTPSHRTRARVRYDSANEALPLMALRGLAVLVVLAAAWLGYRFLTVNG
jgi:hypothetical protein